MRTKYLTIRDYSLHMPLKRSAAVLIALAVAGAMTVVALAALRPDRPDCHVAASLAPECGAWWGAAVDSRDSALRATVTATEFATGHRFDIVHTYHRWDDVFPTSTESQLADDGRLLFMNWEPVTGAGKELTWASIAAGRTDPTIRAEAHRLSALGRPVLVSFSHEPELNYRDHGALSDFAAAFRHVVTVSKQSGASNVKWVWDLMGLSDPVWRQRYPSLWPGAAYVDWIGWDPYNAAGCKQRSWQSFSQTVTPFYQWLQGQSFAAGKPFMLAEYGTVEGTSPAAKADWFAAVPAALHDLPRLKALVYFDLPAPPANCDWLITTSAASMHAFSELASSRIFRVGGS